MLCVFALVGLFQVSAWNRPLPQSSYVKFRWQPISDEGGYWRLDGKPSPGTNLTSVSSSWIYDDEDEVVRIQNRRKVIKNTKYSDYHYTIWERQYDTFGNIGAEQYYTGETQGGGEYLAINTPVQCRFAEYDSKYPHFKTKELIWDASRNYSGSILPPEDAEIVWEADVLYDNTDRIAGIRWRKSSKTSKKQLYRYSDNGNVSVIEIYSDQESDVPSTVITDIEWDTTDNMLFDTYSELPSLEDLNFEKLPYFEGENRISSARITKYIGVDTDIKITSYYKDESVAIGSAVKGGDMDFVIDADDLEAGKRLYRYTHQIHFDTEGYSFELEGRYRMKKGVFNGMASYNDPYGIQLRAATVSEEDMNDITPGDLDFKCRVIYHEETGYPLYLFDYEIPVEGETVSPDNDDYETEKPYTLYGPYVAVGEPPVSEVKCVGTDDMSIHERWYRPDGTMADAGHLSPGLYIRVKGPKSEKILVK